MKKTFITVPDLHTDWFSLNLLKEDIRLNKNRTYIFLGDYIDSYHYTTDEKSILFFKEMLELKKKYPRKVILLLGNHDASYFLDYMQCSRYNKEIASTILKLITDNLSLFKVAYQYENILWSHAGVANNYKQLYFPKITIKNIDTHLNKQWLLLTPYLFNVGKIRGGFDNVGGIFWADVQETFEESIKNLIQVVGHSKVQSILINRDCGFIYTDCLHNRSVVLLTEIDKNSKKFFIYNLHTKKSELLYEC